MRVLVAPDAFAGTLTAVEAARAIGAGWARRAPHDELDLAPMSDGGAGLVDVLSAALGGEVLPVPVRGPDGSTVPGAVLVGRGSAYVEAAQACGPHLVADDRRDPERASSYGVGQLVEAALAAGVRRVVVGLEGTAVNDGGAGLLAALGATAEPAGALVRGPSGLAELERVDLTAALGRCRGVELVAASDDDGLLCGLLGTTRRHGPGKGLGEDRLVVVDAALERLARLTDRRASLAKGAGAGGGLGFALQLLGGRREPGVALVAAEVRLPERAARADLVVTGEGAFDFSSRSGTVPYGVAAVAAEAIRPCVALAGEVLVGSREMRAMGVESAYSVVDLVGRDRALADPAGALAACAERVARTWSPGRAE